MTKTLRKAIIHRSKLKNNFNKKPTDDNWQIIENKGIFV